MRLVNATNRVARRGASAAELAFVLPVLSMLALGCIDFGRFAYHHVAVTNAARAGAEYGIMNPYVSSTQTAWRNQVQNAARAELTGQTGCDPTNLAVTTTVTVESSGLRQVKVEASYTAFRTVVSWPGIPSSPRLRSVVVMRAVR